MWIPKHTYIFWRVYSLGNIYTLTELLFVTNVKFLDSFCFIYIMRSLKYESMQLSVSFSKFFFFSWTEKSKKRAFLSITFSHLTHKLVFKLELVIYSRENVLSRLSQWVTVWTIILRSLVNVSIYFPLVH